MKTIQAFLAAFAFCMFAAGHAWADAPLGTNLAPIRDWATQQPFLDVMKSARRWIGHRPHQWGGMDYDELEARGVLDTQGWPTHIPDDLKSIGTLILTDQHEQAKALSGRYVLRFDGDGIVEVRGRAQNIRYGDKSISFDFTPGPDSVDIRILRTDRRNTGDYVRNIRVVRENRLALFETGEIFNPDWLAAIDGFAALRFMDWMDTNDSTQSNWEDRPRPKDFSYTRAGAPIEVMIALANKLGTAPWFTIPHLADDTYMRNFAETAYTNLAPDLPVYAEFSNEVWNWQFEQARWAEAEAQARWGREHLWVQHYGVRAAEAAQIWAEAFANDRDRLINVIATQTGWLGLEEQVLEAPDFVAESPDNRPPFEAFDAYAITGYFSIGLGVEQVAEVVGSWLSESLADARRHAAEQGLTGEAGAAYVSARRYDAAIQRASRALRGSATRSASIEWLAAEVFPYHREVARRHGLDLIVYEAGTHVVGIGALVNNEALTDFFQRLNYADEMGPLYTALLENWNAVGGEMFVVYTDVMKPSKWGSWGNQRFLGDDTSRWRALRAYIEANR